jgi:chromosome partitioning protein
MSKVIAVSTNKGGVLKSSITTNLAGVYSQMGKVLIIDTDNQGNAALSFGLNPDKFEETLYDVLVDGSDPWNAIVSAHKNIDLLPSNDDMAFFEFDVLSRMKNYPEPFTLLKQAMKGLEKEYDYILVDTPPNLGLTQGNVLSYVQKVLIPFQPESYSMRSLMKILKAIGQFKNDHNPKLKILGIVATLVDSRTVLHSDVLQECRRYCYEKNIKIYDTVIPKTVRFAASIAYEGLPATLTDKNNILVKSYYDLEREIRNG